MPIKTLVLGCKGNIETDRRNLGTYLFDQVPSIGEHVHLTHYTGKLGIYHVLCVAYDAMKEDEVRQPDQICSTIYVELIREI